MSDVIEQKIYSMTELKTNHNKFWIGILYSDDTVETRWGRIEDGCMDNYQSKKFLSAGRRFFEKKCSEKERKGYTVPPIINNYEAPKAVQGRTLAQIATAQIKINSPIIHKLIERLAETNIHVIEGATSIKYNTNTGMFMTDLGPVTLDGILDARDKLNDISHYIASNSTTNDDFTSVVEQYLRIIPQGFGRRRIQAHELFPDIESIEKQNQILDSLDASLSLLSNQDTSNNTTQNDIPKLFAASIELVEDDKTFARLNHLFRSTLKSGHSCSYLRLKTVYAIEIEKMKIEYDLVKDKIGNVHELWHGSKIGNLLSILQKGFVVPPSNSAHVCGRLFGNGTYFANSSTKSLNYSYGYWDGTRNSNCFMFLCDVAVGRYYVPRYGESIKPGYDSLWAKAGQSGIQNDEIVVPNVNQINPKYLLEFTS